MSDKLLIEIARCPTIQACLNSANHPCAKVVQFQGSDSIDERQVPEPWSGRITQAPVLFISSNPSISYDKVFPTGDWPQDLICDFFNNRFGDGRRLWMKDGKKSLRPDGEYGRANMFLSSIRKRAIELFERDVNPGGDYSLTEVVHCKSKSESGVSEALDHCVSRYLRRGLSISRAHIFVVLGKYAKRAMKREFDARPCLYGPTDIGGQERIVAFLPHPNAREPRAFEQCFPEEELNTIRAYLRGHTS